MKYWGRKIGFVVLAAFPSSNLHCIPAIRTKVNDRSDRRLEEAEAMMRALERPDAFVYQSCKCPNMVHFHAS